MPSNFHHPVLRNMQSASSAFIRLWGNTDRLTQVHFAYAVAIAFVLHMLVYGIWLLVPKTPILDIPVRVLNIKLGDTDDVAEEPLPQASTNNAGVEQALSKVVKDIQDNHAGETPAKISDVTAVVPIKKSLPNLDKLMTKSKPFDMRTEGVAVAAPVISVAETQFVRETKPTELPAEGSVLGNSTSPQAEIMARYEQLISAWIDKFKPSKLMVSGQPERATASVRIRIDRRGNIRYMELEKSTDFAALDRAAIDTVRRANPVPAAPVDYPSGEVIEFLVPIVFRK